MAKILIVDDDKDIIEIVHHIARQGGHQVIQASDGRQGLQQATSSRPDLIILDVMMPEMDGYTLNTHLLANTVTRNIPVIILTAKGRMREVFAASPNVRHYMDKPFEPTELQEHIQTILAETNREP